MFEPVGLVPVHPARATVYELGWQSWSPAGTYPGTTTSPRPARPAWQTMAYRPGLPSPAAGFQSEGYLAVDPGDDSGVVSWLGRDVPGQVPTIRARLRGRAIEVSADGPVDPGPPGGPTHERALALAADEVAARAGCGPWPTVPPGWCSWYCHWTGVTEADVHRALEGIEQLDLPVEVVQIDDGWQEGIGDWTVSPRFGDLGAVVDRIRSSGRQAGIWLAPFLVGGASGLASTRPDWLLADTDAGHNWDQRLAALDVTKPVVAAHLASVVHRLRGYGIEYFKLDFLYAGALSGTAAYRDALAGLREAAGPGVVILGCGAPLLPSVGLVDAMRVSPDVGPQWEPPDADVSQPGGRSCALANRARRALHGRLWVSDPDCLLARPEVERRSTVAEVVGESGGVRSLSDRIEDLDDWGLETARRLLRPSSPTPDV